MNEEKDFRKMTCNEILKVLGVSPFRLPFLLRKARKNIRNQILKLAPVDGLSDILREIKQHGATLGILTSNSIENVLPYLKKHGINIFDFVYTGNNVFNKHKHIKKILRKAGLNSKNVVYVGDEIRDLEAAQKSSVQSVAVLWGYNHSDLLQEASPTWICESSQQLLSCLKAFISK